MSIVRDNLDGEKVVMERQADPGIRSTRRLVMAQMKKAGCTIGQIARHYRYTRRHVQRELAEFRKQRERDNADRRSA